MAQRHSGTPPLEWIFQGSELSVYSVTRSEAVPQNSNGTKYNGNSVVKSFQGSDIRARPPMPKAMADKRDTLRHDSGQVDYSTQIWNGQYVII